MTRLFIVATERSGDELGAGLGRHLRTAKSDLSLFGIGGAAMEEAGIKSRMDISGLAILGFVEGVKHYPMILKKVKICVDEILKVNPDAVILIDSWGFMIRVANRLKAKGYRGKIIKFVAPQVWAMRAGRAKILARSVDLLLSIQPMDAAYFEAEGLKTVYVGNPVFDTDYQSGNTELLREAYKLNDDLIVSIWFGSRQSEIETLAAILCDAVSRLKASFPKLTFIAPVNQSVRALLQPYLQAAGLQDVIIQVPEAEKLDVMKASHAALACSGTVTTQLASAGVPTVVSYKLNPLTFAVAKRLFKPDYISIVNIAADAPLMPEFIQDDVTAGNLSNALSRYISAPALRRDASRALLAQTRKMGAGGNLGANKKAANVVLAALNLN
jgi:lipid-A-disaccharide synthase